MPIYEYECNDHKHRFEVIQKFDDPPVAHCTVCGGPVHKLLSSPAIQFKGSGFYITDYARKGQKGDGKSESTDKSTKSESSTSTSSDSSSTSAKTSPTEKSTSKSKD